MTTGHEKLDKLQIRLYRLTTKSHLRVGAGEGSVDISAADNAIIRALMYETQGEDEGRPERVPYIPGSSLHGVIRSWVEKALRSEGQTLSVDALRQALDRLDAADRQRVLDTASSELGQLWGKTYDVGNNLDALLADWSVYPGVCDPMLQVDRCERISGREVERRRWKERWQGEIGRGTRGCKVCSIFGYTGQRGKVKITPAFPLKTKTGIPIDVITRVAINRLTGAADEGKLFDMEAIPPGVDFYFFVILENLDDAGLADFEMGIRALSLQLATVGAHATIGFGMVECDCLFTAQIDKGIFRAENLEAQIDAVLGDGSAYRLTVPLDAAKYPRFFVALARQNQAGRHPDLNSMIAYIE